MLDYIFLLIFVNFYENVRKALTMFIAIMIPFFGGLLAFFGGFAFAPTTYFVSVYIQIRFSFIKIDYQN